MNYGYFKQDFHPDLNPLDETERFPIHLYHHVSTQIPLKGLKVLEVGSGRGGGASYIARYLMPASIIGIDISNNAINLSNDSYNIDNLNFVIGDSENIPFEDNYFDAVINIESSHCYPSLSNFMTEVSRVLRPGGHFLYCDLVIAKNLDTHLKELSSDSLKLINHTDITENIIKASELMTNDRINIIEKIKSPFLKRVLSSFASVKGSKIYNSFVDRHYLYISALSQKK
jgi:ubiquinone/menaquinone biosynthesis C-methylase UbiE